MKWIKIDKRIFQKHKVKLAYLFGSRAKGIASSESDFDIAVLFEKKLSDPLALKETTFLSDELRKFLPAAIDVISLNNAASLLKYEAISCCYPLYSKNENERVNFEVLVLQEYIDDQFMRDIYTKAMIDRLNKGVYA